MGRTKKRGNINPTRGKLTQFGIIEIGAKFIWDSTLWEKTTVNYAVKEGFTIPERLPKQLNVLEITKQ